MSWVRSEYLDFRTRNVLRSRFQKAKPFPHLVLREFFTPARIRRVRQALLRQNFEFKESDLFRFHQTADISGLPNKVLQGFYQFFNSQEFCSYVSEITRIPVSRVSMSGFIYSSTDHLLPHDDRLEDRRIAYVVNLSEGFTRADGGALSFFSTKNNVPVRIVKSFVPLFNSLFLFEVSARSFHQVDEVLSNRKRVTLAGWFYG